MEDFAFTAEIPEYFGDAETYHQFQSELAVNPEAGDVMVGTGGFRKMRWADKRRGKGKRGGLRVIYLLVREAQYIVLVMVYDKDEQDDISARGKRELAALARAFKEALMNRNARHRKVAP